LGAIMAGWKFIDGSLYIHELSVLKPIIAPSKLWLKGLADTGLVGLLELKPKFTKLLVRLDESQTSNCC
jgi:hypothetical protein